MHFSPVHSLFSIALLGAALVDELPRVNAVAAEHRLALAALHRVFDYICANLTLVEICSVPFLGVFLEKVLHLEMFLLVCLFVSDRGVGQPL